MSSRKSSEKEETGFKDEKEEREEKRCEKQEDRGKVDVVRAKARLQEEGRGRASVHSGSPFRCGGRSRWLWLHSPPCPLSHPGGHSYFWNHNKKTHSSSKQSMDTVRT